jgi:hypothetical protein
MQSSSNEARNGGNRPSLDNRNTNPSPNRPEFNSQGEYGIALQQFDWGHPTEAETRWLVRQGVSFETPLKPRPLRRITFDRRKAIK